VNKGNSRSNGASRPTASGKSSRRAAKVLDAAIKVFHRRGYADATVQEVADDVGILKGSLYHYIDSKEDLLFWIAEKVEVDAHALLSDVRGLEGLNAIERIGRYVERQVTYNMKNLEEISIYYHDLNLLGEERLAQIRGPQRNHTRELTALIETAQDEGVIDEALDARLLTNCVFATMVWVYQWYRPTGYASRDQVAAICRNYALAGLTDGRLPEPSRAA
jgi:AcrR family transcriptional regulator